MLAADPSAANHQIVLIKHRRLSGRDGTLRQVQFYFRAPVVLRRHRRRRAGMVVTDFYRGFDFHRRGLERYPVASLHREFIAIQRRVVAHNDAVVRRIQFNHIDRLGRGDAQTLPLADGVKFNAIVVAEDAPVQIHNLAAMLLREVRLPEKFSVILVRHETNLHAFLFFGGLQLALAGGFARVALGLVAHREQGAGQLVLPE